MRNTWVLSGALCLILTASAGGCTGGNNSTGTAGSGNTGMGGEGGMAGMGGHGGGHAGAGGGMVDPQHEQLCKLTAMGAGTSGGFTIPGVAGAPRWGIPDQPPAQNRVRKSWSKLDDTEKKKVVDAFIALKGVTTASGSAGSARANYTSFCDELGLQSYERNLYDFYVEAHMNAYISMMTPSQSMTQMAHMAPQFLAWHRYLLLRMEADLGEAIGDPNFALPYWDWTDCYADGDPKACATLFNNSYLGSGGSCDDSSSSVQGYLTDQGFKTNVYTEGMQRFSTSSVKCGQRAILRKVGCLNDGPPDSTAIDGIFARLVYDSAPYDSCYTEEDTSFRQYLEGFTNDDTDLLCVAAGCTMHSAGHVFIGGDMQASTAAPNDPMFFLNHAEVDRLWAAWQAANMQSGDPARMVDNGNPGYPDTHKGPLFNFDQVNASELFDYKALGYEYDTLPAKK
jgi:tyrosinase